MNDNHPDAQQKKYGIWMLRPQCEACNNYCEVYGSSWCAACADSVPRHIQERILKLRNALLSIGFSSKLKKVEMIELAREATEHRPPRSVDIRQCSYCGRTDGFASCPLSGETLMCHR